MLQPAVDNTGGDRLAVRSAYLSFQRTELASGMEWALESSAHSSQQTSFSKRERTPLANDDMIEDANIDVGQRFLQPRRQHPISRAALRAARRMVVAEDHRSGVPCQSSLQHDTGINSRAVDRTLKQALECQHAVLSVQKNCCEDFVGRRRKLELQILPRGLGMRQARTSLEQALLQQQNGLFDELFLVSEEGHGKRGRCDAGNGEREHGNLHQ